MKNLFLVIFFSTITHANENCFKYKGDISVYNGWPPTLRFEFNGEYYGIYESNMPEEIVKKITKLKTIIGEFCLSLTNEVTSVPYKQKPIYLVQIKDFTLTE